ncbi:hypothetical protein T06_7259 [Trichinella sp. T6]|nr:hypothetical protein T06_7259 [Trichinella sp. T6]
MLHYEYNVSKFASDANNCTPNSSIIRNEEISGASADSKIAVQFPTDGRQLEIPGGHWQFHNLGDIFDHR